MICSRIFVKTLRFNLLLRLSFPVSTLVNFNAKLDTVRQPPAQKSGLVDSERGPLPFNSKANLIVLERSKRLSTQRVRVMPTLPMRLSMPLKPQSRKCGDSLLEEQTNVCESTLPRLVKEEQVQQLSSLHSSRKSTAPSIEKITNMKVLRPTRIHTIHHIIIIMLLIHRATLQDPIAVVAATEDAVPTAEVTIPIHIITRVRGKQRHLFFG
jgi:hypothetical protein